jgi:hypothetical protein
VQYAFCDTTVRRLIGRRDFRYGLNPTEMGYPRDVRFPPDSDQTADIGERLERATTGLESPPDSDVP